MDIIDARRFGPHLYLGYEATFGYGGAYLCPDCEWRIPTPLRIAVQNPAHSGATRECAGCGESTVQAWAWPLDSTPEQRAALWKYLMDRTDYEDQTLNAWVKNPYEYV